MLSVAVRLDRGLFRLDVAFEADAPITGVFGPSGAGKSTLIDLIAGLERPDAGRIALDGEVLFDAEAGIDVPAHRRRVGVVFQEHRLFAHMNVEGNLRYGWRIRRDGRPGVEEVVDLLELAPLLRQRVGTLSGGERQRVALGRALLAAPRLLLLDEPLASLDRRLKGQILPYLDRVREAASIPMLYVSHDLTEVLRLTDRLLVLDSGRAAGPGPVAELAHDEIVAPAFDESGFTNVVRARVDRHREADGVTELLAGENVRIVASPAPAAPGATVTIAIRPADVSLAAGPVPAVSIRNQLQGTVTRRSDHDRFTLIEVDVGVPVVSLVSRRSAEAMALGAGTRVLCLIKSHAIQYLQ